MRSVDQPESFAPLGAPIRPEAAKPTAPRPEGPSGVVTINGKAQTTSHPKPPMRNYSDILDTQGMVHRDSFPPNSLKWVGEAADRWRNSVLDESGMPLLAGFAPSFIPPAGMNDEYTDRDMGRKADKD